MNLCYSFREILEILLGMFALEITNMATNSFQIYKVPLPHVLLLSCHVDPFIETIVAKEGGGGGFAEAVSRFKKSLSF